MLLMNRSTRVLIKIHFWPISLLRLKSTITFSENVSNFFALLEKRGKETNCVRKPVRREKPSPNVVLRPSIIVMAIETEIGTEEETIVTYTGDRTRKGKKVGEMTEEETIPDRGETMRRVVEKKTGGERR